ncbi:MAG: UDP-N-acetylmuramoyl-L-alanine--D-glutamate ligase [Gallionella sp.]|nr:UDP-N-acetylmuramoyl-L-alanine--D-glutamate ligase [Gallionella sp.]
MESWADKKVLVLGLGETGLSMLRWLSAQGARLRVADSRDEPPGLVEAARHVDAAQILCGPFNATMFDGIELIAISPGIPLRDPVVANGVARGIPVVGDIELFAQQLRIKDSGFGIQEAGGRAKVIAITGSNGKSTVTSMVEHLCRAAGKDAVAAGNISPAVLDVVAARGAKQPEVWVLELSSFQLETTFNLNADVATVLNVSADHLDRYGSVDEYAAAKARIFQGSGGRLRHVTDETTSHSTRRANDAHQVAGYAKQPIAGAAALHPLPHRTLARTVSGVQVLNRDDARCIAMALPGREITTFGLDAPRNEQDWGIERDGGNIWLMHGGERLLKASELQVAGLHNIANALAALALCRAIGLPLSILLDALRSFEGLPHRVQRVAEVDGVVYFDDSKGTNVGATVAALQGLGRKAVLIAGGEGKGQDFAPLSPAVVQHARAVVLIGRDAPLIEAALHGCGVPLLRASDMDNAVHQAARMAQRGDAVLLSPACASFDMFRNYAHRAEVFVAAVHSLHKEVA